MWKVIGAERDTGADVEVELDAADEASARRAAAERGIFVAELHRIEPAPPTGADPSAAEPSVAEAWVPDSSFAIPLVVDASVVDRLVADASADDPSVNDLFVNDLFGEPSSARASDAISPAVAVAADAPVSAGAVADAADSVAPASPTPSETGPRGPVEAVAPESPETSRPPSGEGATGSRPPASPPPASGAAVRPARRVKVRRKVDAAFSGALADRLSEPQPPPRPRPQPVRPPNRPIQRRPDPRPVRWPEEGFRKSSTTRRREAFAIVTALAVAMAAGIAVIVIVLGPPHSTSAGLHAAVGPDIPADHANFHIPAAMPAAAIDARAVGTDFVGRDSVAGHSVEGDSSRARGSDLPAKRDAAGPPRARQGPIEVVLLSAAVQRFAPTTITRTAFGAPAPGRLVLAVRVRNASVSSKWIYRPWSAGGVSASAQKARLLDDDGRVYPLIDSDFGRDAVGAGAELGPGEAATDVLAFETPPGTFTHLDLELPPGNTGGKGAFSLTLRIPASAVSR